MHPQSAIVLDVDDDELGLKLSELPPVRPGFFISRLKDAPQNPIMETLLSRSQVNISETARLILPNELAAISLDSELKEESNAVTDSVTSLWSAARLASSRKPRRQVASWDALRNEASPRNPISSPFLSEQDQLAFAAIRQHLKPRYHDPTVCRLDISEAQLTSAVKLTMLGTSSVLHIWDIALERFTPSWNQNAKKGRLAIAGRDAAVSTSVVGRFITIGTLLRRLETFHTLLRVKHGGTGPTIFAFAHALSAIMDYIRSCLVAINREINTLTLMWARNAEYEDVLIALSQLCGRDEVLEPRDYPAFDPSPHLLLSQIHRNLARHIDAQAPRLVRATLAYILATTSHDFIQQICYSVGYSKRPSYDERGSHSSRRDTAFAEAAFGDEDEEDLDGNISLAEYSFDDVPAFLSPELLDVLPAAQKSLKLLKEAQADHPILNPTYQNRQITWFWTDEAVTSVWNTGDAPGPGVSVASLPNSAEGLSHPVSYQPELAMFSLFDLDPGAHSTPSATSSGTLVNFIASFPDTLPPLAGTLPQLISLVFSPLTRHAARLSGALMDLLLQQSSHLYIPAHLELLRSHLLLTSHAFRVRLSAALFCDSEDGSASEGPGGRHAFLGRHKTTASRKQDEAEEPKAWPVGLAPALLQRGTWPPVGADLSFLLRTVINDSLDLDAHSADDEMSGRRKIAEEAEFRLGFAIRDLPAGTGREKWLDPKSIEALDFLYMEYKPPHPLDVVITPDILGKYKRVFAFLLRLMRVQEALQAVFRMTRKDAKRLFPTFTDANRQLLHFRFISQAFVGGIQQYTYDTCIGGNFDAFLTRLAPADSYQHVHSQASHAPETFPSVFALADAHSDTLDAILGALLLRSSQRIAGDLLRGALELVLEFANLVEARRSGAHEEHAVIDDLQRLYNKFVVKVGMLVKMLKSHVEKNLGSAHLAMMADVDRSGKKQPLRGAQSLLDLLIRLDLGKWWLDHAASTRRSATPAT